MDAGLQAARAFSSRSAGPVFGHLLLSLIHAVNQPAGHLRDRYQCRARVSARFTLSSPRVG